MDRHESTLRQTIVTVGQDLYRRGMIVAGDGNISARLNKDTLICTPSGLCKGRMHPEDLIIVDMQGNKIRGNRRPSSELKMHLTVYELRADVHAIVHAHPPVATGFSCAGIPLDKALISEVVLSLGRVPIAPYGTPSTEEVSQAIAPVIKDHDALLLANHGALTLAQDLMTAYYHMETVEHFARISHVTHTLGKENLLTAAQVEALIQITDAAGTTPSALKAGHRPVTADNKPEK